MKPYKKRRPKGQGPLWSEAEIARIRRHWLSRFQWILLAFFPAHFAALTFLGRDSPNWILSLIGALLAGLGLARLFRLREERVLLVQYLHLLGYLSSRLAAGIPLESAFGQAGPSLVEQLGRHNPISRSLMKLKKNLEAQLSLQEALNRFSDQVNLPVCKRDFTLLIMLARTGGRIDVFIRQIHEDLSAQISAQEQVAQERRGQSSEALIMSIIPFFIAQLLLDPQSSYGGAVLASPNLAKTLTFLYLAAMSALFILLLLLAPAASKPKTKRKADRQRARNKEVKKTPLTRLLSRLYLDGLPGQLGSSVSSAVQQLARKPDQAWTIYLRQKGRDLLYACLFAGALALTGKVPWYLALLIPFLVSTLRDMATCKKADKQKDEYRFFYPSVISSLHSLLESGLTLDRSLRMMARVNSDNAPGNPVTLDLPRACLLLETGYEASMVVRHLAQDCPLPEIQAALRLMARYQHEGGSEILELIRMQSDRSRQLYRDALRGQAEERSILFILPMAMDLLIVMATAALPALVSIRSII